LVKIANSIATWAQVTAEKALKKVKDEGGETTKENIKKTKKDTKEKIKAKKDANWNNLSKKEQKGYINKAIAKRKESLTKGPNG
jgi:hypothetical protein